MARLNVAPTKSNLLRFREELKAASAGFALLDQKREILVMELMRLLDRVRRAQLRLQSACQQAYGTAAKAVARNGFHAMRRTASGIRYDHQIDLGYRVVAGVRVPVMDIATRQIRHQFGMAGTDSLTDETMRDFLLLLEAVSEMAQLESAVWLLARELKKTQRRVNALEKLFIPDFDSTVHYIRETLESKELEAFAILKMVKERRPDGEDE